MCGYLQVTWINRYTKMVYTDVAVQFSHTDEILKKKLVAIALFLLSQTHSVVN